MLHLVRFLNKLNKSIYICILIPTLNLHKLWGWAHLDFPYILFTCALITPGEVKNCTHIFAIYGQVPKDRKTG